MYGRVHPGKMVRSDKLYILWQSRTLYSSAEDFESFARHIVPSIDTPLCEAIMRAQTIEDVQKMIVLDDPGMMRYSALPPPTTHGTLTMRRIEDHHPRFATSHRKSAPLQISSLRSMPRALQILFALFVILSVSTLFQFVIEDGMGGGRVSPVRVLDDDVIYWSERHSIDSEDALLGRFPGKAPDAIIVLCGGSHLPPWSLLRFDAAIGIHTLLANTYSTGDVELPTKIVVSGGGSPHVAPWVVDADSAAPHVVHESTEGCQYMRSKGYQGPLMKEISSYDTIGNAFFVRMLFTEPAGWERVVVVTSKWHMERTRRVFEYVMRLRPSAHRKIHMVFVATDDGALPGEALQTRVDLERRSLEAMEKALPATDQMSVFHTWLMSRHQQYDEYGPKERDTKRTRQQNSLY